MKNNRTISQWGCYFLVLSMFMITGCAKDEIPEVKKTTTPTPTPADTIVPLKTLFGKMFPIGAAVASNQVLSSAIQYNTLRKHFSSITPENCMKPDAIERVKGVFTWAEADRIVAFAQANNMKVRGHCLTWHSQTPDWMFYDENGALLSKEVALKQLKEYITAVVSRYKGKIYAWDVVNEALSDWTPDANDMYRKDSPWYKICGDASYIDSAFVYAHRADPNAKLFYNDYNEIYGWKRNKIYNLVKGLKDRGIPIHGLGMQAHWNVGFSENDIRTTLDLYKTLGVDLQLTELDLSVYKSDTDASSTVYTTAFSESQELAYPKLFKIIADYKSYITGVTFWGVADDYTWLDKSDRKAFPFLLNTNHQPKKAYGAVQKMIKAL
ncbi:endo-1,4-beta-xylanase [Parabacteroides sp. FAFU027]|uniref:endo-1,4-beta-xylanase n=1 Tax=Parabacteroides sp. FAFU027 TaxID=2922715 RepID=UPI001FB033F8|nr:endo-1,4-beta-xylanase [Parabacteroides sp. FAFU027]